MMGWMVPAVKKETFFTHKKQVSFSNIHNIMMKLIGFFGLILNLYLPKYHHAFTPHHHVKVPVAPSCVGTHGRFHSISSLTKSSRIPSTNGSITKSLYARRPLLSEDDLATPPDPKVIEAVESLKSNNVLASGK